MTTLTQYLDKELSATKPSKIVYSTVGCALAAAIAYKLLEPGDLAPRTYAAVWRGIRLVAAPIINKEIEKSAKDIKFPTAENEMFHNAIPEEGMSEDAVVALSNEFHDKLDQKMDKSLLSGVVYWGTQTYHSTLMKILDTHLWANPLFADYFGATRKMEAEVTNMALKLFNAPENAACTYTLGGTESCVLAVLAYRNKALAEGIEHPEMIIPQTAHPAFHRAAEYFKVRIITCYPDPKTHRVMASDVEKYITKNTVAIVASSPNFPFGVVDDLKNLSDLALKYNIGLHSDGCLGGFIIQFMKRAGFDELVIDFRLPGVTSISADIHKWGGSPKGSSIVMFREKELRRHSTFAFANYPGGLYVSGGLSGSRPGFLAACAWATILRTGMKGYVANTKKVVSTTRKIAELWRKIPHIRVMGDCETTVVPFTSDDIDIYMIMKEMRERGWVLNALQFPVSVHLGVTMEHTVDGIVERMTADLKDIVAKLAKDIKPGQKIKHDALIYGSTQGVSDRTIINDVLRRYVDKYYTNKPAEETA